MSATPTPDTGKACRRRVCRSGSIAIVSVIAAAIVATAHGFSAAATEKLAVKSSMEDAVILAGRWKGPRYGFNMRMADAQSCGGKPCELTYDIVACPEGWCGIAVSDTEACGAIGLRLKPETKGHRHNAFAGKLELAKGSAPYTVEAWYGPAGKTAGEGRDAAHLSFVGDTGGELLMMRRSFPFQAELARIGDAQCTLEKATS